MNISVSKIIDKMQHELQVAKNEGNEQKLRERLMVIRTLCDLVLDETPSASIKREINVTQAVPPTTQIVSQSKLEEEDANGDSLFDF